MGTAQRGLFAVVMEFEYLDSTSSQNCTLDKEIIVCISKTSCTFSSLYKVEEIEGSHQDVAVQECDPFHTVKWVQDLNPTGHTPEVLAGIHREMYVGFSVLL